MKKRYTLVFIIFATINCYSQEKDSIFFMDKNDYLALKINYEHNHRFFFKNESFVSSAFEAGINVETMNHFAQTYKSIVLKKFKPKKVHDIKEYLNDHKKEFIDTTSKKYDSYKLMLHFDKFILFIKKNEFFIKVTYSTPLAE